VTLGAFTTTLGLIPLGIGVNFDFYTMSWNFGSEMNQYWNSMAVAMIFGVTFATILTLVIVPVLYSLTVRKQEEPVEEREPSRAVVLEPIAK
jgi:multidrug efflux pump subunit AcrB